MGYLPFIDGLRAVAILAVVAFHAVPQLVPGGYVGVDVFFVISGFLITRFIAAEMAEGSFSLVQFYVRRARRLMPAAVVCFLAVTLLSAIVLLPDAFLYFGRSLLAAMLMFANVFFYQTGGYFSAPALEKPLLHTWSLAVEDQFYLTWPILLVALWPLLSRRLIIALAIGIAAASFAYAEKTLVEDAEFAFFVLPTRAWELLLGALVALLDIRARMSRSVMEVLAALGAFAIVASFWWLNPDAYFPGLGALPACLGTAAIIVAGCNQMTIVGRLLALKPAVFIGLISYSLYLWHWPLIALSSYRLERALTVPEAAAVVAVAFGAAILSWWYVEQPFRKRHQQHLAPTPSALDQRFILQALAAVMLIIGISMVIRIGKGLPQRYTDQTRVILSEMVTGNPVRRACDNYGNIFRNDEVCNLGRRKSEGQSYDVALFGDSMADHWTPLVAKFAKEERLSFRQVTNGGCALLFGVTLLARPEAKRRECANYRVEAEKFVAANPELKLAVISAYWEKWRKQVTILPSGVGAGTERQGVGADVPHGLLEQSLRRTIAKFTSRGVRVLLIGQIPIYDALPLRCIVRRLEGGEDISRCGMTRAKAMAQLSETDAVLRRVAADNPMVGVWLPSGAMCQEQYCSPMLAGHFLYKNRDHVNAIGSEALRKFVVFPKLP